jgi:hypothetical protein
MLRSATLRRCPNPNRIDVAKPSALAGSPRGSSFDVGRARLRARGDPVGVLNATRSAARTLEDCYL